MPRERKIYVIFRRLRDNFEFRNAATRLPSAVYHPPRKGGERKEVEHSLRVNRSLLRAGGPSFEGYCIRDKRKKYEEMNFC